jgi:hypothetical protein
MTFIHDDQVIKALPADTANQSFNKSILPGRPRRGDIFHLTFELAIFGSGKRDPLSEQA